MAEINDLDFFDDDVYGLDNRDNNPDNQNNDPEDNPDVDNHLDDPLDDPLDEDNALYDYLRSKGINPDSVKMQNDEGETEEFRFDDLSKEEQLQLLHYNPNERQERKDLAQDEEKLLQILRSNNMSVQDYLNAYKNHVIEQYQASIPQPEPTFDVDEYTDEQLFIADLKDKVPDLTEEEAQVELEMQMQNPELFKKKVDGLRESYRQREEVMRQQQEYEETAKQQLQAAYFELLIVDTIQNNNSIDLGDTSLELSADDMNLIASFILDSDLAGVRYIAKALNDPRMLVEMAWWALKGHEALNLVTQYYKKQISEARKSTKQTSLKPTTVVTKKPRSSKNEVTNEADLFDRFI